MTVNQMPPVRKMGVERNITLFYTTTNIRSRPKDLKKTQTNQEAARIIVPAFLMEDQPDTFRLFQSP